MTGGSVVPGTGAPVSAKDTQTDPGSGGAHPGFGGIGIVGPPVELDSMPPSAPGDATVPWLPIMIASACDGMPTGSDTVNATSTTSTSLVNTIVYSSS